MATVAVAGLSGKPATGVRSRASTPPPTVRSTAAASAVARGRAAVTSTSTGPSAPNSSIGREADVYGLVLLQALPALFAGVSGVLRPEVQQLLAGPELGGSQIFWLGIAGGALAVLGGLQAFRATYPLNGVLASALAALAALPLATACALWGDLRDPAAGATGLLLLTALLTCAGLAALADRAASQQPSRLALLFCVLLCYDLDNVQLQVLNFLAVAFLFLVERPRLHCAFVPSSMEHLASWACVSFYSLVLALLVGIKLHMDLGEAAGCWAVSGALTLGVVASAHRGSWFPGGDGRLADALRVYTL